MSVYHTHLLKPTRDGQDKADSTQTAIVRYHSRATVNVRVYTPGYTCRKAYTSTREGLSLGNMGEYREPLVMLPVV